VALCDRCGEKIALANDLDQSSDIDRRRHRVMVAGKPRSLTATHWQIFVLLYRHRGVLAKLPLPPADPPRGTLGRRGRDDTGAGRGHQCDRRCAERTGGAPHRDAGDSRAGVARDPRSARRRHRFYGLEKPRLITAARPKTTRRQPPRSPPTATATAALRKSRTLPCISGGRLAFRSAGWRSLVPTVPVNRRSKCNPMGVVVRCSCSQSLTWLRDPLAAALLSQE
jgi:hypothetical protein